VIVVFNVVVVVSVVVAVVVACLSYLSVLVKQNLCQLTVVVAVVVVKPCGIYKIILNELDNSLASSEFGCSCRCRCYCIFI